MKLKIVLVFIILLAGCSSHLVNKANQQITNPSEIRQVHFAERVIFIELIRDLSFSFREARQQCSDACPESGALELGVGLIGISKSDVAKDTLINLLGLKLDGSGAEEFGCQILSRGSSFLIHLENLQAAKIYDHCQATFKELRKRELEDVNDVSVEQVCHSEVEINTTRDEYIQAIKSKSICEE